MSDVKSKTESPTELHPLAGKTGIVHYLNVTAATVVYIGLGFLLHPDPNTYLLIGIPITILFQVFIARRPLKELWLRKGQALRFDRRTIILLIFFLVGPIQAIVNGVQDGSWPIATYGSLAVAGSIGAALSFRILNKSHLRQLLFLLALMIPIGLGRLLLQSSIAGSGFAHLELANRLLTNIQSLLFYVPALFIVEEVFFRGALDSYLYRGEQGQGWGSAAFVSILWGLWHMPIAGPLSLTLILKLIGAQLVMGLILSWFWRQSGNMAMPGTLHAIIDALRNALMV